MYRNLLELVDDLNWLAKECKMKVRHFRLYRKTDKSREVVLLYNPSYAGYAGDDQTIDLRHYLHIWVFEKETTRMCDAITCQVHRLDIRQIVADDFTLIIGDDIRIAGISAGVVQIIPESPSLGDATAYTPALLHEGRELHLDWFIY